MIPDLGDFSDVEVIEVLIKLGDTVQLEDPLVTLETDKAAMDVPATAAGTIDAVLVKVGDTVSKGSPVVVIDALETTVTETAVASPPAAAPPAAKPPAPAPGVTTAAAPAELPSINESGFSKAHASPSVRKLARELGVNLVNGFAVIGKVHPCGQGQELSAALLAGLVWSSTISSSSSSSSIITMKL